ncbi:hypothetical protein NDU88_007976 [Pleurodeles waltl]|uniref:Uncharacterized protein n=1 Tax=Pleurodeles waltl TaxID=8319 RepID=A0AAV7QT82_PLEWA|nr:hypothetical protein NDU88_007976 [Pleurodeles waltl]
MGPMPYSLGRFSAPYQQALFLPFMPMGKLPWPSPVPRKMTPLPTDTQQESSVPIARVSEGSMLPLRYSIPVLVDLAAPVSKFSAPISVSPAPLL